jgi:alanine racemase
LENGVTRLAVAMLDEAIELRQSGIRVPILVLGYTDACRSIEIIRYDVTQTIYNMESAIALSEAGKKLRKEARVHIKIDTGMGRIGFAPDLQTLHVISEIRTMPYLFIEGIFTHFACADEEDPGYTNTQFDLFMNVCKKLEKAGISIPIRHVCNSAATLRFPAMHLDMVRIGIMMYGMSPSPFCNAMKNGFRPAMTLKTRVILVKELEKDQSVSYGRTFRAKKKSFIATLPVGYADGYSRVLSNQAPVLIHGKRYPLVGNICMDMCMADVTRPVGNIRPIGFDNLDKREDSEKNKENIVVQVGDEAVLFGFQGEILLDIDEIAAIRKTINYELTCNIGRRVPRVYLKHNQPSDGKNYLTEN